jgi:hypothetical protein
VTSTPRSTRSRRSSGEPDLPTVFIDRSLGRYGIVGALRCVGFTVHPLHEVYPDEDQGDRPSDPVWIRYASERDWAIFSKDGRLRRGENLQAICDHGARVFLLPKAHWTEAQQIERFIKHRYRIALHCQKPGPFIYVVYRDRPQRVKLPPDCQ